MTRWITRLTLLAIVPLLLSASAAPTSSIEVYFSPHGGCTDAIVRELRDARKSVRIQALERATPGTLWPGVRR